MMPTIVCLLVCMGCIGYGRRSPRHLFVESLSSHSLVEVNQPNERAGANIARGPAEALATYLLAFNAITSGVMKPCQEFVSACFPTANANFVTSLPTLAGSRLSQDFLNSPILVAHPVAESLTDPYAQELAEESQKQQNEFNLNVGKAIDSLNTDLPDILREQPNWNIYTEDLELDLRPVDAIPFRLIGGVAGLTSRKINGLGRQRKALKRLQKFRRFYVKEETLRLKMRLSQWSLTTFRDGEQGVECRWNARLKMKSDLELIPRWAGILVRFAKRRFPHTFGKIEAPERILMIDGVSRFYFNSEGRIYRHVIDNIDLLPHLSMPTVNEMLWLIGIQPKHQPQLAYLKFKQ